MKRPRQPRAASPRRARGTALLLAMVILTLVAGTAAGMVWQQRRAIQIEAAERARSQAAWVLQGALDWARLVLREDRRTGAVDHLGEPWAVPLAEARLSTFLAADTDPTLDDGPQAFLSGRITDLQSHYNVTNVVDDEGKVVPEELAVLQRLCERAGAPSGTADRIAQGLASAEAATNATGAGADAEPAALVPLRFDQLAWLGVEPATLERMAPFLTLLPERTPINLNTAPSEVIAATIDGLDPGTAERLVQRRQRQPFASVDDARRELPQGITLPDGRAAVSTRYFEVIGRLRLDERVVEQRALVQRGAQAGGEVVALWRERRAAGSPQR